MNRRIAFLGAKSKSSGCSHVKRSILSGATIDSGSAGAWRRGTGRMVQRAGAGNGWLTEWLWARRPDYR